MLRFNNFNFAQNKTFSFEMCGIFFILSQYKNISDNTILHLRRRGPDSFNFHEIILGSSILTFISSVLHIRGNTIAKQPCVDEESNILLWNGEAFDGLEECKNESDTKILFSKLSTTHSILSTFSLIRGPFAFIFWNHAKKTLWFGRDFLGRRSLCLNNKGILKIGSICDDSEGWKELSTNGIYSITFSDSQKIYIKQHLWSTDPSGNFIPKHSIISPIKFQLNKAIPENDLAQECIDDKVVSDFIEVLEKSVQRRVTHLIKRCKSCEKRCNHSSLAVLFSGGLDSTVLAIMVDKFVETEQSIDLLNVAFSPNAPDRITGLSSWKDLTVLKPSRQWNFVSINVDVSKLEKSRNKHIRFLLSPNDTVLDDSVGCALWFAARGKGILENTASEINFPYTSPARVLIIGIGIDEQLGGYSRHRGVFGKSNWIGLIDEIELEINRISSRNLGRDDRVISDHGREVLFPFLDEEVVNYLNSLPIWKKMDLRKERGKGEKMLLRLVAKKMGLISANYLKRAIQFGSKIAKLENANEKASDKCVRLIQKK